MTHRSGSIAPAMLMHLVYNLMGTLGSDLICYLPAPFLILLVTNVIALVYAFRLLRPEQGRGAAAMQLDALNPFGFIFLTEFHRTNLSKCTKSVKSAKLC